MSPQHLVPRRWHSLVSAWVVVGITLTTGADLGSAAQPLTRSSALRSPVHETSGVSSLAVSTRVLAVRHVAPDKPTRPTVDSRALALPPRSSRSSVRTCRDDLPGWVQARGAHALAQLHVGWQRLGYQIRFLPARDGYLGMTYPAARRIELFVRSCSQESDTLLAVTLAHELGHAFDLRYGTTERRSQWLRLRGVPDAAWFPPAGSTDDFGFGAGDFAEVFAMWAVSGRYFASELAPRPTRTQLTKLIALLRA